MFLFILRHYDSISLYYNDTNNLSNIVIIKRTNICYIIIKQWTI